jgi:hypothetical protein
VLIEYEDDKEWFWYDMSMSAPYEPPCRVVAVWKTYPDDNNNMKVVGRWMFSDEKNRSIYLDDETKEIHFLVPTKNGNRVANVEQFLKKIGVVKKV